MKKSPKTILIILFIAFGATSVFFQLEIRAEQKTLEEAAMKLESQEKHLENLVEQYRKMQPMIRRLHILFDYNLDNPEHTDSKFQECFHELQAVAAAQKFIIESITTMKWIEEDKKVLGFWINNCRKNQFTEIKYIFLKVIKTLEPWEKAALNVSHNNSILLSKRKPHE